MRRKDVHLAQNAAGRLLEGAGDRTRREMTVRSPSATDRTRLTDWLLADLCNTVFGENRGPFYFLGA